ncbi:MAG TPA: universal stress protein [Fimbriimonadaceae bacterium]|nr:universal stress protein [Fimbriimonadaceae bacterium]
MKILVGIDVAGTYRPVVALLGRLDFQDGQATLAHAVDVLYPVPMYGVAEAAMGVDFVESLNQAGEEALQEALDLACLHKLKADTAVLDGAAGPALIEFAERNHYDLIAIHSVRKGRLGSLFLGSVARGLAIGARQSVLISKGEVSGSGPVKAVFATDHSAYAQRALDMFIALKPRGIRNVHVVSAAWMNEYEAYVAQYDLSKMSGSTEEWVEAQLRTKNHEAVEKLKAAGFEATSAVKSGTPDVAIREAMELNKSDILVMGAQGHGFIHRLFIGSTSLHQVVAEPYSVLILRPDPSA